MKLIDILVEELPKRGGWPEGASRLAQDPDGDIQMLSNRHAYLVSAGWTGDGRDDFYGQYAVRKLELLASDYATSIVTREQYEAALAAKNEGWIEWGGGECPIENGFLVDVKLRNGRTEYAQKAHFAGGYASYPFWRSDNAGGDIIAYRLHQPQEAEQTEADDEADLNECIGQDAAPAWDGAGLPPVGCMCERSWAGDKWLSCKILFTSNQIVVVKLKGSGIEDAYYIGDVTFRPIRSEAERKRDEAVATLVDFKIGYHCHPKAAESYLREVTALYDAIAAGKIPGVRLED